MLDLNSGAMLLSKVEAAPAKPGCYIFLDKRGYALYVGKAKSLNNRVRSYFTAAAAHNRRTADLVRRIADVEYRQTSSELDALLLEYRLIKQLKPWHNSQMKPEKERPYLRVARGEPLPSFSSSRQIHDDGADYYDFFADEYDIKRTLDLLCKVWGIPQCGTRSFSKPKRPCISHTLGSCLAPCSGKCDKDKYAASVNEARRLLGGARVSSVTGLKRTMKDAAKALDFEKAAEYKSLIDGLERVRRKSRLRFHLPENGNVLVLVRPRGEKAFSVFYIANEQALCRTDFPAEPDDGVIRAFVSALPDVNVPPEDARWLADALIEIGAHKQFIALPGGKGDKIIIEKAIRGFAR